MKRGGTSEGEKSQDSQPPPGLSQHEEDRGGVCVTVGQLAGKEHYFLIKLNYFQDKVKIKIAGVLR